MIIEADITDDVALSSVSLQWAFNGNNYPCPTNQTNVSCTVTGARHRWTVLVNAEAPRPFSIRAIDAAGNVFTSPQRTVTVRTARDSAPVVSMLEPAADAVWRANSAVRVIAAVADDVGVATAERVWSFNGNRYGCPSQSQYVDCTVSDELRTWTVRVGAGTRSFHVEAKDTAGNTVRGPEIAMILQ